MRALVVGCGRTGEQVARELRAEGFDLALLDRRRSQVERLDGLLGGRNRLAISLHERAVRRIGLVVVCCGRGDHQRYARWGLRRGVPVVSLADDLDDVESLLALDETARAARLPLVVGAGFAPGLGCALSRHAGDSLDAVDEIHLAKVGTGGPDCARSHHRALRRTGVDWRDGRWLRRQGGSGRQLAHFPEPLGPRDCYRAALADPLLLLRGFPTARRITARVAATRRDRLTAPLPMLRPPHPDGGPGAIRVEVWGRRGGSSEVVVLGCAGSPARIAGMVAAITAIDAVGGRIGPGVSGLAEQPAPTRLLGELHRRGVAVASYEGVT